MRMFAVCFGVAATLLLGSRVAIKDVGVHDTAVKVDNKTVEVPATTETPSVKEVKVDETVEVPAAAAGPPSADGTLKEVEVDKTVGDFAAANPPPVKVDNKAVEVGEVGRRHRTHQLVRAKWGGLKKVQHPVWGDEENFCFTVTEVLEHTRIADGGESQVEVGKETCIPMREKNPEIEGTPRWLTVGTKVKIGWYYDSVQREWKHPDGTTSRTVTMERLVTELTESSKFTVIGSEYLASQIVTAVFKGLRRVSAPAFQAQDTKGCFNVTTTVEYRKKSVEFGDAQVAAHQEYCVFLGEQLPGVRTLVRSLTVGTSVKLGWSHRFVHFKVGSDSAGDNVTTISLVRRPVTVLEELPKSKGNGPDNAGAAEPSQTTKPPVIREEVKTEMMSSQYVKAQYKGTSERTLNGEASATWACFEVRRTIEYKQQDEEDEVDNQVQVGQEHCARPEEQVADVRATLNILAAGQMVKLSWEHNKVTRRKGSATTVSVSSSITYLVADTS